MKELYLESFAKINLALDVLCKRGDGYHEIRSIMQQIDLRDRLLFKEIKEGVIIESNHPKMPKDSTNLVHKVWDRLREISGIKKGIHVRIEKDIPMMAGLAGGSSNAAATLRALNQMWNLKLSDEELMDIGKDLGADIPFCILGGTALAEGIGEKLTRLKSFSKKHVLLCNPGIDISTPQSYKRLRLNGKRIDIDSMIKSIEEDDIWAVSRKMANKMEEAVLEELPIIQEIKDTMLENDALGSLMSGSGSTVFGLYDDKEKMEFTRKKLLETWDKVYISETI